MSEEVKDLLAAAAGPTGKSDESWIAKRVDRLYFSDPSDLDSAGQVDVYSGGEGASSYVRLELWISPLRAAEIIALVTGEQATAEIRISRAVEKEHKERLALEALEMTSKNVETVCEEDLSSIERADRCRSAELDRLIAEQTDDDQDGG